MDSLKEKLALRLLNIGVYNSSKQFVSIRITNKNS